ncbi:hypothetical protein [Burkholderia multivorans]|uniref:hypothetical protein n=1 Tax=Burkholderia multivorans TaxID=87883 RepID=UPI0005BDF55B|nr:hypothetical protein [Burkholderia multivorans]AOJ94313.1 hypothetical protein WK22_16030 [Burkholderia multivorans]MBH9663126.1 hypothetical protein [Burkholderia multivorans]MBR8124011.1 hypothetical protein [Burkholderia multivorans]MBU9128211.1 hypothetical protein [Burkholderia multivorans]MBU9310470.1 hypothetical protein [Burkholderia multivorans]
MLLLQIDDATRDAHPFLRRDDHCWYCGDYTARGGLACSPIDELVADFQKSVSRQGRPEYRDKTRAIQTVGRTFRNAFVPNAFRQCTFVPVPPSKPRTAPEYDDRMVLALGHMAALVQDELLIRADVRELVLHRESYVASHLTPAQRMRPEDLIPLYEINETIAVPQPKHIIVVDDILTTGSHFVAMKTILQARYPNAWIGGLFIGRRPEAPDF